jgi:hypothetical protein
MQKTKDFNDLIVDDLTLLDRCDRCGAQAYMRAFKDDLSLLFCGHHGKRYFPSLFAQGFLIQDETFRINKTSESSA